MNEKGKWWKIYFWILIVLTFWGIGSNLVSEERVEISSFLGMLVSVVSLIGLLGYIYQARIFSRFFWLCIFFANIVVLSYAVYNIHRHWTEITEDVSINEVLLIYGVGFIFIIPLLVALYSYTFNSSQLWDHKELQDNKG